MKIQHTMSDRHNSLDEADCDRKSFDLRKLERSSTCRTSFYFGNGPTGDKDTGQYQYSDLIDVVVKFAGRTANDRFRGSYFRR